MKKYLKEFARRIRNNSPRSERIIWNYLKNRQFYDFNFHRHELLGEYIVDFYSDDLNLVIELDEVEEVAEINKAKDAFLQKLGLSILRFRDEEVLRDTLNVIRRLEIYKEEFCGG